MIPLVCTSLLSPPRVFRHPSTFLPSLLNEGSEDPTENMIRIVIIIGWIHLLLVGLCTEIKYHSGKSQTCLNATAPNAVTPHVCDLFLLSPLKSASAAASLDQHGACYAANIVHSILLLSFSSSPSLSSFPHHYHIPFPPLSPSCVALIPLSPPHSPLPYSIHSFRRPLAKGTNIPYLPPSSPLFNQLDV